MDARNQVPAPVNECRDGPPPGEATQEEAARRTDNAAGHVHRIGAAAMRAVSPLPPPEEVFADWLMSLPHDADIEHAARLQIALIDGRASLHADARRLRVLLLAMAGAMPWQPVGDIRGGLPRGQRARRKDQV